MNGHYQSFSCISVHYIICMLIIANFLTIPNLEPQTTWELPKLLCGNVSVKSLVIANKGKYFQCTIPTISMPETSEKGLDREVVITFANILQARPFPTVGYGGITPLRQNFCLQITRITIALIFLFLELKRKILVQQNNL